MADLPVRNRHRCRRDLKDSASALQFTKSVAGEAPRSAVRGASADAALHGEPHANPPSPIRV